MDLSPETILNNRYRIIRPLGKGGMGAVYLAYDGTLENEVAVKCNRNPASEATTQFLKEAQLLASLRHPNLPRVIDYFIDGDNQFLVMDYIPGDDLLHRLEKEGPQPLDRVLDWADQLGSALAYLHSQTPPVIHRDIKPATIKLMSGGEAMLVDFGIAKTGGSAQATTAGATGYTPGYAPPEQYSGVTRTGPLSDQYALAATLYHLLTGHCPSDSVQRVLGQAVLTPISIYAPRTPGHIQAAVEKALSVKPDERFPDVGEFIKALYDPAYLPTVRTSAAGLPEAVVAQTSPAEATQVSASDQTRVVERGPVAPPPPSGGKKGGLKGCGLWAAILGGLAMIGVIATVLVFVVFKPGQTAQTILPTSTQQAAQVEVVEDPAQGADEPTEAPLSPTTEPPTTPEPSQPPQPEDTATPTPEPVGGGRMIAFISDRGGDGMQIWTMKAYTDFSGNLTAGDFTQITFDPGDKSFPAWSPDGTKIIYSAPGNPGDGLDLWLVDLDNPSAPPVALMRQKGDDVHAAWSPDGLHIAYANIGKFNPGIPAVYWMNSDGSNSRRLSLDFEEYSPFWTNDMQYLMYVIHARDHKYIFMRENAQNSATLEPYTTPQPYDRSSHFGRLGEVADPDLSPDGRNIAYTQMKAGAKSIWIVEYISQGARTTELTPGFGNEYDPTWSPDSQYIAFTSQRDGNDEIYVMTSTGQLQTNLSDHPGKDMFPAWQP